METVKTLLYGIFWLLFFNPFTVFIVVGSVHPNNPPWVIGCVILTAAYYRYIWITMRMYFIRRDKVFVRMWLGQRGD